MYALAEKILEEQQIPGEVLLPLIDETAAKVHVMRRGPNGTSYTI